MQATWCEELVEHARWQMQHSRVPVRARRRGGDGRRRAEQQRRRRAAQAAEEAARNRGQRAAAAGLYRGRQDDRGACSLWHACCHCARAAPARLLDM